MMNRQAASKGPQHVFKPREAVTAFSRYFPIMYAVFGTIFAITTVAAIYFQLWLMPVFMAFPLISLVAGGVYVNRIKNTRVVIDLERLRVMRASTVVAAVPWRQVSRLTMRQQQGGILYEVWVKDQPIMLPAGFLEDGDKLVQAVSARAQKPWDMLEPEPEAAPAPAKPAKR